MIKKEERRREAAPRSFLLFSLQFGTGILRSYVRVGVVKRYCRYARGDKENKDAKKFKLLGNI